MKKIIALILLFVFTFTACQDNSGTQTSSASESKSETSDVAKDENESAESEVINDEAESAPDFIGRVLGYWHMEGGSMQYFIQDDMTYVASTINENVYGTYSVDEESGKITFVNEVGEVYEGLYYAVQDYLEIDIYDNVFYHSLEPIEFIGTTQSIDELLLRDWRSEDGVYHARFDNQGYFAIESSDNLVTGSFTIDGLNVYLDYDFLDDSTAMYDFDNHILTIDDFGKFYWIYE